MRSARVDPHTTSTRERYAMKDDTTMGITRSCNHIAPLEAILGAPTRKAKAERIKRMSSTKFVGGTPRQRVLRNATADDTHDEAEDQR